MNVTTTRDAHMEWAKERALSAPLDYIPGWPSDLSRTSAAAEQWRNQDLAGIVELPWLATQYACSALRWGAKPEQVADALTQAFQTGVAA